VYYHKNLEKMREKNRARRAAGKMKEDPAVVVARTRAWREANPDRKREGDRARYKADPAQFMRWQRKSKYRLTDEQLQQVENATSCDACGEHIEGRNKHVDHDHETGRFRGVLCRGCNMAEGCLKGSLERVLALGVYLENYRNKVK